MLDLSANFARTEDTGSLTTVDLIRNLGRFPAPVLPVGVMRELLSRGEASHDGLVNVIREAIDSPSGNGFDESRNVFYCFALLVPLATNADRSLIESLLTMPDRSAYDLIGDLISEALPYLIENLFQKPSAIGEPGLAPSGLGTAGAADVIEWIERLLDQQTTSSNQYPLLRSLTLAVTFGHLDRATAIDAFVRRLEKGANDDSEESAIIVCELIDLAAHKLEAVDTLVRACFERGQIDESYIDSESWDELEPDAEPQPIERRWTDPALELRIWPYEFVSDDLDPMNATFRVNEDRMRAGYSSKPNLQPLISALQKSTYDRYPQEAFDKVKSAFGYAYGAVIQLISQELARYQSNSQSWSGNGAYLGLVLTISNQMPLPMNLLETMLQLPIDDRESLFGDQFGLIVQAAALTPQTKLDFVEQWIWDSDRCDADRREMVDFFVQACHCGHLERETAISLLVTGLRRALLEKNSLISPYAENLAFLTPTEHSELLEEAFSRDDVEWLLPPPTLRRMAQDAKFAHEQFRKCNRSYLSTREIIGGGVMFDSSLLERPLLWHTPAPSPRSPVIPTEPSTIESTTIRSDARTPRNDPCPCGSGKKYKKCCMK